MKKWFRKHRHGIQTALEVCVIVAFAIELILALLSAYMLGKTNTTPVYSHVLLWVSRILWIILIVAWVRLRKYNREHDRRKIYTHNIAAMMVDEFEEILDQYDITIPDEEREGGDDEARIYGTAYDKLLSNVELRVIATLNACCNEEDVELICDKFE